MIVYYVLWTTAEIKNLILFYLYYIQFRRTVVTWTYPEEFNVSRTMLLSQSVPEVCAAGRHLILVLPATTATMKVTK